MQGQRSEITRLGRIPVYVARNINGDAPTRLNGLFGQAAKTLSSAMSPAKTDETAQPSSSSSSSSSSSNREIEDDDEDEDENDQDGSFLFPIRPQAGGPTLLLWRGAGSDVARRSWLGVIVRSPSETKEPTCHD